MDLLERVLNAIFNWPFIVFLIVMLLRKSLSNLIDRLINSENSKAKLGPLEIELGTLASKSREAISELERMTAVMAKSRRLELEITNINFGAIFSREQQNELKSHICELEDIIKKYEMIKSKN